MKSLLKTALIPLIAITPALHAAAPVPGWYAGMLLGGTMTPKLNNPPLQNTLNYTGSGQPATLAESTELLQTYLGDYASNLRVNKLSYGLSGNIGAQVGYRFLERYRLEGQLLLTQSSYQSVSYSYTSITGATVEKVFRGPKSDVLGMKGSTTAGVFLFNGFIDLISDNVEKNLYPYFGAGVGYAYVSNQMKFLDSEGSAITNNFKKSENSPVVQGIVGLNYSPDTFTMVGLDYRYLTTKKLKTTNASFRVNSINITFSGIFNCA